jgi:Ca2+-binding EF-hand superfamily protein
LPPNISNSFGISQTELDDLRHAFQLFDTENKGKILLKDVRAVLESIRFQETSTGSNNTSADSSRSTSSASSGGGLLDRVLARIRSLAVNESADDTNMQQQQQRLLSMPDFIALMTQPDPKNDQRSEMRKVFDLFDVDRKGHINANDLGRIAAELGEVMDRQELQEMIQRASSSSTSSSSSGKVYPQDFEAIMSRRLFS